MTTTADTAPSTPGRFDGTTLVWVREDALSEQRRELQVGQELVTLVRPSPPTDRSRANTTLFPRWHASLNGEAGAGAGALQILRGRIEQILAVTAPHHRVANGAWEPVPGAAVPRAVTTTCAPDPARSVWIPSGNPALIGFLIRVADARVTVRIG